MSLFDDAAGVVTPGEGVGEVNPNVFQAGNHLHSYAVNVERRGYSARLPKVHDHLLGFIDVEDEVVLLAPQSQTLYLLPVCHLVLVGDEPHHCCVISELHYEVAIIGSSAVVGEQFVEQRAEDAALGGASVEGDG